MQQGTVETFYPLHHPRLCSNATEVLNGPTYYGANIAEVNTPLCLSGLFRESNDEEIGCWGSGISSY
ncbi:hypothetical protein K443DRAFT_504179 [Laccaria amethystina LaAM-08-1]|uniref:Uncharacterized protein n=1 Tax=Laccaria amethystina LaAM-08-1 TaxID=1095629 RepID=A0A0C9Y4M8_9AGAR|nr:hypothetical protein K443DRAFT_504179 [Laccaria amethystina LaAM-08-1]